MKVLSVEEYKARILDVLIKVDGICRENNFRYFIFYGTLIGDVRHKGFIPWDDDIDIIMPREDYYKLADYIIGHPETGLNYIDIYNRKDTIYYCAKVCDAQTVVKESRFRMIDGYGAFVDVFPFDYLPEDSAERNKLRNKEVFWEKIHQHSSFTHSGKGKNLKHTLLIKASDFFARFFNASRIIEKMHNRYMESDKKPTNKMGVPFDQSTYDVSWLRETTELLFEGHLFLAPKEYDTVLKATYGDYMQLPPEEERVY
jgi:lipopolysaccharide cholinephosphotransferase